MNRSLLALLFLCLSLLAAACGDDTDTAVDDDGGDTTTEDATDVTDATEADVTEADVTEADATEADATEDTTEDTAEGDRSDWPDKIVLGLVPSREADVLVENAVPLEEALSEALGVEVEGFVPQDYTGLTEAMNSGQADIGAFGPLGVVRAMDRAGVEFILQSSRFGSLTYHTQYMTNNPDKYCTDEIVTDDEGYQYCNGTADADQGPVGEEAIALIDTSLAYVDPTSTSGYLIPALQLLEAGIDLDSLETTFAGGHDNAVLSVSDGTVEVGLSFDDARGTVIESNPEVAENVVVFAYSQEIPNDGWTVRADLPDSLKEAITQALLDYAETEEGVEVLDSIYEIDGLVPAEQGVLDVVREADEQLGDTIEEE